MKKTWTIVIIIVVLVIVIYGGYRVMHHMQAQQAAQQAAMHPATSNNSMMKAKPTAMMTQNSVYKTSTDPKLGAIMADAKGMTLYTYSKDTNGVSNCSGGCLKAWPAYIAPSGTNTLPANISIIKRTDGTGQFAWKGMPLYYFTGDKKAGDVNGNGVAGLWSVVKL